MKKINANAKLALITWNHWEKKSNKLFKKALNQSLIKQMILSKSIVIFASKSASVHLLRIC